MRYTLNYGGVTYNLSNTTELVSFACWLKSNGKCDEWDMILVWDTLYSRRVTITTIMKELS
jgi:hypothetical protein